MPQYKGRFLTVHYDPRRCIHAAECVRGLPTVFDPARRPWIDPERAGPEKLIAVIERCPTGALHYERSDGGPSEMAPSENVVRVAADGPLYVHGDATIADHEGRSILIDTRIALCRCGASRSKPFCDGSHEAAGFTDPGLIPDTSEVQHLAPGGRLSVTLASDGPLVLSGTFRLEGTDAKSRVFRDKAAFCRCGASATKPYCDGSHARVGFKDS
jgi:CDGSH-type Zn-finger protein/uncharacterized Fe-S cluster protein YjdI